MDQQNEEVKRKEAADEKVKNENKEAQDKIDKPHNILESGVNINASFFTKQPINNIKQFNDTVKIFLTQSRLKLVERVTYTPLDFTMNFEKAITSLVDALYTENDLSQVLYLYSHLIPLQFDVKEKYFKEKVTLKDLEQFSQKLDKNVTQYHDRKCSEKVLQAWILKGLLSSLLNVRSSEVPDRNIEVSDYLRVLDSEKLISDATVKDLISRDWSGDIDRLISMLDHIIEGKDIHTLQWDFFANKDICHTNSKQDFIRKTFNSQANDLKYAESRHIIPDFVKRLQLSDYFPGKLTVEKALTIKNKQTSQSTCIKDLPWIMLKHIISGDFKFREKVFENLDRKDRASDTSVILNRPQRNMFAFCKDIDSVGTTSDTDDLLEFYPLDVFLILYICCDPFLKGLVAQKIFSCQLALPLIYKDCSDTNNLVFSLWPLRGIVTTAPNQVEKSVVAQDTSIISFFRIGKFCKLSKSKVLNEMLRDQSEMHYTFFHRDCKHGMHKRTISDGMVEIAWYVPTEDEEERNVNDKQIDEAMQKKQEKTQTSKFQQPFTILNMRGNAEEHKEQTGVMLHISQMVVVFVEFKDLKEKRHIDLFTKIHSNDSYVIIVTRFDEDMEGSIVTIQNYVQEMKVDPSRADIVSMYDSSLKREFSASEMKTEIIRTISEGLKTTKKTISLEQASKKAAKIIYCDENIKKCVHGKELAMSIFSSITEIEPISRKDKILPLQGEGLWRKWAKLQKENSRSNVQNDINSKRMMDIRERQTIKLNSSLDIMARFIYSLIQNIDQNEICMFFLAWLKCFLDDESKRILPGLRDKLNHAFCDFQVTTFNGNMSYVEECKANLSSASLGLEHFFREMAQIYEAFYYTNKNNRNRLSNKTYFLLEIFPYLAAKLLLLGYPLELMDGDAANVPQKWTDAVMEALGDVTGNSKIVSISVLGIQSSGKSTLLNTMFGLQLSVSAGRCTKGAFLQLLPISSDKSFEVPAYAAIIDTEGLRAQESSGKSVVYDNELATLVIGLADIIILNIKGEIMGEMENILQIVVHELLRLKQVHDNLDLSQSVMMIHQNISAKDAAAHLEQGNLNIVTSLNKVTKEAASQACMSGIECFKDVIHFDSRKHVKYIPDLWLGNPPMAPVNPRYCSQTIEVLDTIFRDLVDNRQFLSVKDFSLHMQDLWSAILAEDFVFSFHNGLQIKAYNLLDAEYLRLKWRLEKLKMDWEDENIKQKLSSCDKEEALEECSIELGVYFRKIITDEKVLVLEKLDEFIRNSDLRHQMLDWQESKNRRLIDIVDELIIDVKRKIRILKDQCIFILKQNVIMERRRKRIYEITKTMAKSLQGEKPSAEVIRLRFNDFWRQEVTEAIQTEDLIQSPQITRKKIKSDIETLLCNQYETESHLLGKHFLDTQIELDCLENSLNSRIDDEHISVKGYFPGIRKGLDKIVRTKPKYPAMAAEFVNSIFRDIDRIFIDLLMTDVDYDKTHFSNILFTIKERFSEHNEGDGTKYKLSPDLEILVSMQASHFACKIYKQLNSNYFNRHSVTSRLESLRPRVFQLFEDILSSKTNEIIAANSICLELGDMLRENIERKMPKDIVSKIREEFGNNKHTLIKRVLIELSCVNNFKEFGRYIVRPESYIKEWLKEYTNKVVFGIDQSCPKGSYYKARVDIHLTQLINNVKCDVMKLAQQMGDETRARGMQDWINKFKRRMSERNLILRPDTFKAASECDISNFNDFASCIQENLSNVEKELTKEFESHEPEIITWLMKTPYQAIFEALWGCTAKCPFL